MTSTFIYSVITITAVVARTSCQKKSSQNVLGCIDQHANASVHEQGKVVQALQCAQRHQLKTISPESFLVKAAETGQPNCLQHIL